MAVPTYQASTGSVVQTGTGSFGLGNSGVLLGDLIVLHIMQDGTGSNPTVTVTDGINDLGGTPGLTDGFLSEAVGSPTAAKNHIWFGRCSADAAFPTVDVTTSGDDLYMRMYRLRGVATSSALSDILENATAGSRTHAEGLSTGVSPPSVQTLGADRLACAVVGINDDNAMGNFTGETGGDWTEATIYFGSATGTDGCCDLQTASMASAGTISGGSFTMAASDSWGVTAFALIPAGAAAPKSAAPSLTEPYRRYRHLLNR